MRRDPRTRVGDRRVVEQTLTNRFAARELEPVHARAKAQQRATPRAARPRRADEDGEHDDSETDDPACHPETMEVAGARVKHAVSATSDDVCPSIDRRVDYADTHSHQEVFMKREWTVGIGIALSAISTVVGAQAPSSAGFGAPRVGVVAGLNLARLTGGDDAGQVSNRVAFGGGVYMAFPVSSVIEIQPEVLYSAKGAKLSDQGVDGARPRRATSKFRSWHA